MRSRLLSIGIIAAVFSVVPGVAGAERTVLTESFESPGQDGLPAGWELWAPEENLRLSVDADDSRARDGERSVRVSGDGNVHAKGSLRWKITGLARDKYYRFRVAYKTSGIESPANQVIPHLRWGKKNLRYLEPQRTVNGWTESEVVMQVPTAAGDGLTLNLFAGWIGAGVVHWDSVEIAELEAYQPEKRPVTMAVIDARPPEGSSSLGNARFYATQIARAAEAHAPDVVFLPEFFNKTNVTDEALAVSMDSEYMGILRETARQHRVNVMGSVLEEDNGLFFNAAFLIDRAGKLRGKYRKTHLAVTEGLLANISRGEKLEVLEADFGKVGVPICWDFHFPEVSQAMVRMGAEILFVPLASDGRLPEDGLQIGVRIGARSVALQHRVPVIMAVTVGSSRQPSIIVDQKAAVLAQTSDDEHIAAATVDLAEKVYQWTGTSFDIRYRQDRRPELYRPLVEE